MTIKNKTAYMDALWDWGFLDDCFGTTRIRVSDVDGIVERWGHVLQIEAKPPGKDVSTGQHIMFSNLAAMSGFTVLVIWGDTNRPTEMMYWTPYETHPSKKMKITESGIHEFVRRWFVLVNQLGNGSKQKLDKKRKWPVTLNLKINGS